MTEIRLQFHDEGVPVALGWDDIVTFKWGDQWLPLFQYVDDPVFLATLQAMLRENRQYAENYP